MGLKRIAKKYSMHLIPILLILLIIPFTERGRRKNRELNPFPSDTIRCVILPERGVTLRKGFTVGYHYETLRLFTKEFDCQTKVTIANRDTAAKNYPDSILQGKIDIAVLPNAEFTPTEGIFSAYITQDSDMVWLLPDTALVRSGFVHWLIGYNGSTTQAEAEKRFFHCFNPYRKTGRDKSVLSPYDEIFKEAAVDLGWDWKMLAAVAWAESKFRIEVSSPRGARGLMQMMPRSAGKVENEDLLDPLQNVLAGTSLLKRLQKLYSGTAADSDELLKFTLAAYNAGEGRIADCIRLARSNGKDASTWESLCSVIPLMSQDPDTLTLQNVKYGHFSGKETKQYVKAVLNQYDIFCGNPPRYEGIDSLFTDATDSLILLRADSLGRVDFGNEFAGDQQQDQDESKGEDISQKNQGQVDADRDE